MTDDIARPRLLDSRGAWGSTAGWTAGSPHAITDALIRTGSGRWSRRRRRACWTLDTTPQGRLALILLWTSSGGHPPGHPKAFSRTHALKMRRGRRHGAYKTLTPFQQAFYFIRSTPVLKIQERSVKIYEGLVSGVSDTLKATFSTFAQFAELHHDIVKSFGRFPHRNKTLGRPNTPEEQEYLGAGAPTFGQ
jgi:uncharacterized protein (DUF924 family)